MEFQRSNFGLEDVDAKKLLDEDKEVMYRQIEETLGLNVPTITSILQNHLHVTNLYCLYTIQSLTEDLKT